MRLVALQREVIVAEGENIVRCRIEAHGRQRARHARKLQPRLFDPRVVNITDKSLGHEVDLTLDWKMNDYLTWSAVVGALIPSDGLEQGTGGGSVWTHFMLYGSVSF